VWVEYSTLNKVVFGVRERWFGITVICMVVKIGRNCRIASFVEIGRNVKIGDNCKIEAGAFYS